MSILDLLRFNKNKPLVDEPPMSEEEFVRQTQPELFNVINDFYRDYTRPIGDSNLGLMNLVQVTLQLRDFPNDSQASSALGPFTVSSSTKKVDTRARARAVALKIANTTTNQSWKLGTFRLDIQPDGRR